MKTHAKILVLTAPAVMLAGGVWAGDLTSEARELAFVKVSPPKMPGSQPASQPSTRPDASDGAGLFTLGTPQTQPQAPVTPPQPLYRGINGERG